MTATPEAAPSGERHLVRTSRADGHRHGQRKPGDLDETTRQLQAYEQARAVVLYAPVVNSVDGIRRIAESGWRPWR